MKKSLLSFCVLCRKTSWPWQAQTPSRDHLSCVVQDVWLGRTAPFGSKEWRYGEGVVTPSRTPTKGRS